jgi:hypothetical protein
MDNAVLNRLKNAGLLSEQVPDLGFVSTGSYALNKIISGKYTKGIPIGMIYSVPWGSVHSQDCVRHSHPQGGAIIGTLHHDGG